MQSLSISLNTINVSRLLVTIYNKTRGKKHFESKEERGIKEGGFVASLNQNFTSYYSTAVFHIRNEEITTCMEACFVNGLRAYQVTCTFLQFISIVYNTFNTVRNVIATLPCHLSTLLDKIKTEYDYLFSNFPQYFFICTPRSKRFS